MELDTTKLKLAGFGKTVSHDNCIVLDVGSGLDFPKYIEIRPTGGDGSRMTAIWDGSLELAVNDKVIAIEYAGNPIWRIVSKGGNDSGTDSHRISKLWESDFGAVALEADAGGNLTLNGTRTLTVPTDIIHAGDDTKISFTDDQVSVFAGDIEMIRAIKTTQDVLYLGDVAGTGNVDVNTNAGQMFLQGDIGRLLIGAVSDANSTSQFNIISEDGSLTESVSRYRNDNTGAGLVFQKARGTLASPSAVLSNSAIAGFEGRLYNGSAFTSCALIAYRTPSGGTISASSSPGEIQFRVTPDGSTTLVQKVTLKENGFFGINGITLPSTELDMGAGAIEQEEMTTPAAGAANTARLFARDDGDGNTEYCIRFSSGLVQVIAPLEFGGISVEGNATPTTITTSGVKVQITIFDTNEAANGSTPDHTNDHITVNKSGTYMIMASITAESVAGAGAKYHFEAYKNNGATHLSGVHTSRQLTGGGGDTGAIPMSGPVVLAAGDTVEVWVTNVTNTQNVVIEDINLAIFMIGVNA